MLPLNEIAAVVGLDYPALVMYANVFGHAVTLATLPALAFVAFGSQLKAGGSVPCEVVRTLLVGYNLGMMAFPVPVGYVLYAVLFQIAMGVCGFAVLYSNR